MPNKHLQDRPLCSKCQLPLQTEALTAPMAVGGTREKYLAYRGAIKAIAGRDKDLFFVTLHAEKQPTGLYRLNTEKHTLRLQSLPCGATALAVSSNAVFAAGATGAIFDCSSDGEPALLAHPFETSPIALALLGEDRLAVMSDNAIGIVDFKTGKLTQTLALPENEQGTCMIADSTGCFLVAGTSQGTVLVFEAETQPKFELSDSAKLHGGAVTALLFEKGETRFLSTGSDARLLSTHVRGTLEAIDRGKSVGHDKPAVAMTTGPHRFYTASTDKTVKAWADTGRPVTLKEGMIRPVALTTVNVYSRCHLAVACSDNSIRLFLLDDDGKPGEIKLKYQDAVDRARYELEQKDPLRREAVLDELAGYNDRPSLKIIAKCISADTDAGIRLKAATLIAKSRHPKAASLLEGHLGHPDEAVRMAVFDGLVTHLTENPLRPVDLAFAAGKVDVGIAAVDHLEKMAARDDRAQQRLEAALDLELFEVRKAALFAIEKILPADSPQADMLALGSQHWDMRKLALIRFFKRGMLKDALVQAALRNFMEDERPEVRQTAYLLSLLTVPRLANHLRGIDADLHRRLFEIETADQIQTPDLPAPPKIQPKLTVADRQPLFKAMACRATDICLAGAYAMALIGDERAFGLLMQLSRETDAGMRCDVCRALMHLGDPRGIKRLRVMIHDPAADVRDAAFSALAALHAKHPLAAVDAGFATQFEDVRRRALDILIQVVAKNPTKPDPFARDLLQKALNDNAVAVRSEAFKAALNLQIAGGQAHTLSFVLHSVHSDIRRNVLMEVIAEKKNAWAAALLTGFFNDPDETLRADAFDDAVDKKKKTPLAVLTAGMDAEFEDIRLKTIVELVKHQDKPARKMLLKALNDKSKPVRQKALENLLKKGVKKVLSKAFASDYLDVRSRAAEIAAGFGDPDALQPLLDLLAERQPEETEEKKAWTDTIKTALSGLGRLGTPDAIDPVQPFLSHADCAIRSAAITALIRMSRPGKESALKQAIKHADAHVRLRAALGLAYCGNPLAERLLFSDEASGTISDEEQLTAAFILSVAGGENAKADAHEKDHGNFDRLLLYLDHSNPHLQQTAFRLLMLAEWEAGATGAAGEKIPQHCIACLAALDPKIRLAAAGALTHIVDDFAGYIAKQINERENEAPWTIPTKSIQLLRELLFNAPLHVRVEALQIMLKLKEKKQSHWEQAWTVLLKRYPEAVAAAREGKTSKKPKYNRKKLLQLAFGAYVGLVRNQSRSGAQNVLLNRSAMLRIADMAEGDASMTAAARPVFIQTLVSPNKDVRLLAFEQLGRLGMDNKERCAEALQVGHKDLGVLGLKLLMQESARQVGQALLENIILMRKDGLEVEAAKLLAEQMGRPAVAEKALQAVSESLRNMAVKWLIADYDQDPKAVNGLRGATQSRFSAIRLDAALALGEKKDQTAFDTLATLLDSAREAAEQKKLVQALLRLGDRRTPDLLLDRLETDPMVTADSDLLITAAGNCRQPETVERLMTLFKAAKYKNSAFNAVFTISGFDQQDYQYPRHGDVLARLLAATIQHNENNLTRKLIKSARLARENDVDASFSVLARIADNDVRHEAIAAMGWRLKFRKGPAQPLLDALDHKDPATRFLAADALAGAGRTEGIQILLAAVELMDDVNDRRRAVRRLGELADQRALDLLLRLAGDDAHALQDDATEAIGHMGQTDQADRIFDLLQRALATGYRSQQEMALKGLRWFGTQKAWALIREQVQNQSDFYLCQTAIDLLGENNDAATIDLLLTLIKDSGRYRWMAERAYGSARKILGDDSLEPDYAMVQSRFPSAAMDSLERVCEKGEPQHILAILHNCSVSIQSELVTGLLRKSPLPVAAAADALDVSFEATVRAAAQIVGRAATGKPEAKTQCVAALTRWLETWRARRQEMLDNGYDDKPLVESLTPCLEQLIWAAGRNDAAEDILLEMATAHLDDAYFHPIRKAAIEALGALRPTEKIAQTMQAVAVDAEPSLRQRAAAILSGFEKDLIRPMDPKRLTDHHSVACLQSHLDEDTLHAALGSVHYQGVVVPLMIKEKNVDALSRIAGDCHLPEVERSGAIEALARIDAPGVQAALIAIGENKQEEEDLRKCAWRALKRFKRAQKRAI
ncbi:HEAT repeat domain-containing protein [Desulfosarcina variabilis]|uniref:HEAT repeat domain-containing protein n=1 Tax=Desulfosarcina variabilis TaxID=2300 RepID=UPI003AFAA092